MFRVVFALALACAVLVGPAVQAQEVERTPTPAWVRPPAESPPSETSDAAPVRILVVDDQVRIDADGVHTYAFRRYKVQTQQGLPMLSTISTVWSPSQQTLQVHAMRIIRGDQVIDALEGQTFQILRREGNLEQSMLDGHLTATIQPRDLRVGDILETAFTLSDTGGVFAPHQETVAAIRANFVIDRYRLRASWPAGLALRVAATEPWADARPRRDGDAWVFEVESTDLPLERMPNDLPGRFYMTRMVQFTDFAQWADVSRIKAPLYQAGSTLEPDSPLKAEIERIRAAHATDAERAAAALRLVQGEVRYVALAMGEGGYVPTPADEVWRSRYGDCKGKTVLLLALLRGLGIPAEAALVSMSSGDGMPERLPLVSWFDHVLLRAEVDGRVYWLDGTATGDRSLAGVTPPPYRWALPITAEGSELEAIVQPPATVPTFETVIEADLSAGLDAEADAVVEIIVRGAGALEMRRNMSTISPDQFKAMMDERMGDQSDQFRIESIDSRYDEEANILRLILNAKTRTSWINSTGGRVMAVAEGGFVLPYQAERKGLFEPYKDHPYTLEHPLLVRTTVRIKLPGGGEGFQLEGADQDVESGGYRVERRSTLRDGVAEVVVTTTSLTHELSAADMAEARKRAERATDTTLRLRAPRSYVATAADRARLDPGADEVDELIERAATLGEAGDVEGAVALLTAAVEREPDNGEARKARAQALLNSRDYAAARLDYDHAVELDPADVEALVGQGHAARHEARHADAIVSYSVALRLDPANSMALYGRAAAYYQIGRWDRALADYRALKTGGWTDTGFAGEVAALVRLERQDEAHELIAARLEKNPDDLTALRGLARMALLADRPADALPALDAALADGPEAFGLLALRGELRARAGDAEGARADFGAMRRIAAGTPGLMNNVCWAQAISGFDLEQALADCDIAVVSGEASELDSRGMALLQLDRFEEARAAYEQALEGAPNLAPSLYGRGLARLALGDEGGREDLARARAFSLDVAEPFAVFERRRPDLVR